MNNFFLCQELCSVPDMGTEDAELAVDAAYNAFQVCKTSFGLYFGSTIFGRLIFFTSSSVKMRPYRIIAD